MARFTAVGTGAEILKQHISLKIQGPAYVLFPYQGNKMEALLVYKSLEGKKKLNHLNYDRTFSNKLTGYSHLD